MTAPCADDVSKKSRKVYMSFKYVDAVYTWKDPPWHSTQTAPKRRQLHIREANNADFACTEIAKICVPVIIGPGRASREQQFAHFGAQIPHIECGYEKTGLHYRVGPVIFGLPL